MADEKFKLPGSSYEELVKIIKTYLPFDKPAGLVELSKTGSLHTTIISRNAGFLIGTDILGGGRDKQLTPKGRKLAQALDHQMKDDIRQHWRTIVTECDFLARVVTAVKIRDGMDETTLQAHIAYSAGQPKKGLVMTGARTVVDILRAAEVLEEQDGTLRIRGTLPEGVTVRKESEPKPVPLPTTDALTKSQIPKVVSRSVSFEADAARVEININVAIDCKPESFDGLGRRIRQLIKDIGAPESTQSGGGEKQGTL